MAGLRGATSLWNAASVAQNAVSASAYIGSGPYVVVYINNASGFNATFGLQVTALAKDNPGLNEINAGLSDGGLTWYDFVDSAGTAVTLTVNNGVLKAFDLSPFGPELVRLKRTDANGTGTISAILSCFGPN